MSEPSVFELWWKRYVPIRGDTEKDVARDAWDAALFTASCGRGTRTNEELMSMMSRPAPESEKP